MNAKTQISLLGVLLETFHRETRRSYEEAMSALHLKLMEGFQGLEAIRRCEISLGELQIHYHLTFLESYPIQIGLTDQGGYLKGSYLWTRWAFGELQDLQYEGFSDTGSLLQYEGPSQGFLEGLEAVLSVLTGLSPFRLDLATEDLARKISRFHELCAFYGTLVKSIESWVDAFFCFVETSLGLEKGSSSRNLYWEEGYDSAVLVLSDKYRLAISLKGTLTLDASDPGPRLLDFPGIKGAKVQHYVTKSFFVWGGDWGDPRQLALLLGPLKTYLNNHS